MIKTCLAVLAAVALAILAGPGPRVALAHDRCPGGASVTPYYYSYYYAGDRHGGDNNCPAPQPAPTAYRAMQQRQLAPAAAASPAQPARSFPAPDIAVSPPAPGSQARTASAREGAASASVSSGAGAAARLTASQAPEGGSPLGIGLGALAVLALVGLIVAGFRARQHIASNLDARWPRA